MKHTNVGYLTGAAKKLGPLLDELVFVGGIVVGLLATDAGAPEARSTLDVDAIAEIASYAAYSDFSERLRELGFQEDTSEDAPICRWIHEGVVLDILPSDERVLGFSSRWYGLARETAIAVEIGDGLSVRAVAAPVFLATKFEAFRGRGAGDLLGSADLEDIITLVDGRAALEDELRGHSEDLQAYVGAEAAALLSRPEFVDALPGLMMPDAASQARSVVVLRRLRAIAALNHPPVR